MAFVKTHQPCTSCDSSDGMSVNDDGSTYCFVCSTHTKPEREERMYTPPVVEAPVDVTHIRTAFQTLATPAIGSRRISRSTVEKYGVVSDATHVWFPYYDNDGKLFATKKRSIKEKKFVIEGAWKNTTLFGQNLFTKGGKYLTIVE